MWDDAKNYDKDNIIECKDEIKNFIQDPENKKLLKTDNFQKIFEDGIYSKLDIPTSSLYQFFRYICGIDVSKYITKIPNIAYRGVEFENTDIVIPNHTTKIGNSAFIGCSNLTNVTIQAGVTSIGFGAFFGCTHLTNVEIGNGLIDIENSAFYGCDSLRDVYYLGTEEEWNKISKGIFNDPLLDANIHFS